MLRILFMCITATLVACGGGDSSQEATPIPTPTPVPVPTPTPTPVPVPTPTPTPVPVPTPTPIPSPFHAGMPQVNVGQNSITVTLGFAGELILGFLPADKEVRLADVAKVCVDSDNLGWADYSARCVTPDSSGVAMVTNTVTNDCFQIHLKLNGGSIVWGNVDKLVMTGRSATKTVTPDGTQCLRY